jgi:hypothetical protein
MQRADLLRARSDPVVRFTSWCFRLPFPPGRIGDVIWNFLVDVEASRYRKHLGMK